MEAFYFLVVVMGVVLAVVWLVFPFIVISKCDQMVRIGKATLVELRKHAETLEHIRSGQNETNRALQYLVDTAALAHRSDYDEREQIAP